MEAQPPKISFIIYILNLIQNIDWEKVLQVERSKGRIVEGCIFLIY